MARNTPSTSVKRAPVAIIVACISVSCAPSQAKHDAHALTEAVIRFRSSPNRDRPRLAHAVIGAKCVGDVCEARDVCAKSIGSTSRGLRLKVEVEQAIARVKKDGGEALQDERAAELRGELMAKLAEAERLLVDGVTTMPACEEKLGALKAKYTF